MGDIFLAHSDGTYLHLLETAINRELEKGYRIIGSSNTGLESLREILRKNPEIVILDTDLPHLTGIDIAKILYLKERSTKCILVFPKEIDDYFIELLIEGVRGVLHKEDDASTVMRCIDHVSSGDSFNSRIYATRS